MIIKLVLKSTDFSRAPTSRVGDVRGGQSPEEKTEQFVRQLLDEVGGLTRACQEDLGVRILSSCGRFP